MENNKEIQNTDLPHNDKSGFEYIPNIEVQNIDYTKWKDGWKFPKSMTEDDVLELWKILYLANMNDVRLEKSADDHNPRSLGVMYIDSDRMLFYFNNILEYRTNVNA